jgi:8-oxo-dGTP pyrophosphatase MutT (NUDIX family)
MKIYNGPNHQSLADLLFSREMLEEHLLRKLSAHVPQRHVYREMASVAAAVLIPIYFRDGEAHLLFTKRANHVEHHKGQISFPGGRQDDDDRDLLHTALRETEEEVGICAQDVKIIGQTDRFLTNTRFMITPWIGIFPYPYSFKVSQAEIDYLVEVPLRHLLLSDCFEMKPFEWDGLIGKIHYYHYGEEVIWGVTGFLLSNFFSIAFDAGREAFGEVSDFFRKPGHQKQR